MSEKVIVSPLPGIFYRSSAPGQPPYKEVGDSVCEGEVIGTVEAMKSFHSVFADQNGTITEFVVTNESEVQAGQIICCLSN